VEYGCIFLLVPSLSRVIFSISWIITLFIHRSKNVGENAECQFANTDHSGWGWGEDGDGNWGGDGLGNAIKNSANQKGFCAIFVRG